MLEELPESLDETYERILREIRKPKQGHAHRLLQCLVAAVRPLRVEELAEVLAFDFKAEGIPKLNLGWRWDDQESAVLSACSSLVIVVNEGDSRIVQFSHYSVKEFLTADRLAEPIRDVSRYHIRLGAAHTILAQACLGVLLQLDDRVDRDNIKNFPLARYAAEYWPAHARFGNASSRIKDGMEYLFDADRPHFATWLWINKDDGSMRPGEPDAVSLHYAARLGFRDLAEHLIAEHPEHLNARGANQNTPMHAAARAGHADIVSLLVDHGADVDGRGYSDQTALYLASMEGKVEAGRCLLDRGADINFRTRENETPLFQAVYYGQVEYARMLLERGARTSDFDTRFGWTPLLAAVYKGNIQAVRLLLEHGADINERSTKGETPRQMGLRLGRHEIVKLLSEYGAKS